MGRLSSTIARIAARIASGTGAHITPDDVKGSNLSEDLKSEFLGFLASKNDWQDQVFELTSGSPGAGELKKLKFTQSGMASKTRHLKDSVERNFPGNDWNWADNLFDELSAYELFLSSNLYIKADIWTWTIHDFATKLFNEACAVAGSTIACRLAAMPPVLNLTKRSHITPSDVNNSNLSPELKKSFKDALEVKSDFEVAGMDLIIDPSSVRGLKFAKDAVMDALHDLIRDAKSAKKDLDTGRFEDAASKIFEYKLTSDVGETNAWGSRAHEIITAVFEDLTTGESKKASRLERIAQRVCLNV